MNTSELRAPTGYGSAGIRDYARLSLKSMKRLSLAGLKTLRAFDLIENSRWRSRRLLILCYHGISLEDEHVWNGSAYMSAEVFESRLELLRRHGFHGLRLDDALLRLDANDLPPRSVVITFDDGTYDFLEKAWPILKACGFPATVYLATQYSGQNVPVFDVGCSYVLWKAGRRVVDGRKLGWNALIDLSTQERRNRTLSALYEFVQGERWDVAAKNDWLRRLAAALDVNFDAISKRRILHVLRPPEVQQLAGQGVDFELHTHTHASPPDRAPFLEEIRENRSRIRALTGSEPVHFCYPCGVYRPEFLLWLDQEGIQSAVTCDPGFATHASDRLLLPRLVDHSHLAPIEFESWLAGLGAFLPRYG